MKTFCLTFASSSPLANGWIEIKAEDRDEARGLVFREFGAKWAFLYEKEKFEPRYFKQGKLGEMEAK